MNSVEGKMLHGRMNHYCKVSSLEDKAETDGGSNDRILHIGPVAVGSQNDVF